MKVYAELQVLRKRKWQSNGLRLPCNLKITPAELRSCFSLDRDLSFKIKLAGMPRVAFFNKRAGGELLFWREAGGIISKGDTLTLTAG